MIKIPNSELYFGSNEDYQNLENKQEFAIIHFCKSMYLTKQNSKYKTQLGKKIYDLNNELFVDVIDEQNPEYFEFEMFVEIINWLDTWEKVFVHCDYGQSRSPSFCMLYGSKVLKVLPSDFLDCVRAIKSIQPDYVSPSGISKFLKNNWKKFDSILISK
jgi:predicted protein tyrosine phosphatase